MIQRAATVAGAGGCVGDSVQHFASRSFGAFKYRPLPEFEGLGEFLDGHEASCCTIGVPSLHRLPCRQRLLPSNPGTATPNGSLLDIRVTISASEPRRICRRPALFHHQARALGSTTVIRSWRLAS